MRGDIRLSMVVNSCNSACWVSALKIMSLRLHSQERDRREGGKSEEIGKDWKMNVRVQIVRALECHVKSFEFSYLGIIKGENRI